MHCLECGLTGRNVAELICDIVYFDDELASEASSLYGKPYELLDVARPTQLLLKASI